MTFIPKVDTDFGSNPATAARVTPPGDVALRAAAQQFESLLLTQLTAALNPKDDAEEGLFGNSGGGMGLSRQMYSEQLAKTMSESGGVGIADMIMAQVTKRNAQPQKSRMNATDRALSAAREIRSEAARPSAASAPPVASAAKTSPAVSNSTNLYPDAIIISEAAVSARPSTPGTASATSVNSLTVPDEFRSAASATRLRRVHANAESPRALNHASATRAPELNPASPLKSSHSNNAYVSFQAPVHGQLRSLFGMRRDPINGHLRLHKGIDIAAKSGTPIGAAAAGTVVFAGSNKGYGNMVMIEHADGRRTVYAHAKSLFVKVGDEVVSGQTIAAVGSTGHSTGPHVHFEIRESNGAVNPLRALSNDIAFARR